MAEQTGEPRVVFAQHPSIVTLLWIWVDKVEQQSVILQLMRVEPDTGDDGLIELDYQIEEIDGILRQLEPLIGA